MAIFLLVVSFPMFQLLFPGRGDVYFRLSSLLDSNRWLFLEVWRGVKVLLGLPVFLE